MNTHVVSCNREGLAMEHTFSVLRPSWLRPRPGFVPTKRKRQSVALPTPDVRRTSKLGLARDTSLWGLAGLSPSFQRVLARRIPKGSAAAMVIATLVLAVCGAPSAMPVA